MKKRIFLAWLCIAVLLVNGITAGAASTGFDYSAFQREGMILVDNEAYLHGDDYIYSYSEEDGEWSCGMMTMGEPYLLLYASGNTDGRETIVQIDVAFDLADFSESATVVEFITEDTIYSLELTDFAQEQGLEGFPLFADSYAMMEALASADTFSVRAYVDGKTYDVEISSEACAIIRDMAGILTENRVMDYYNPYFVGEYRTEQMRERICCTTRPASEKNDSIIPSYAPVAAIEKTCFVANSDIQGLLNHLHVDKNALEVDGFYNDAAYCLLALSMIIDGEDECDLYGLSINEFAASEDDDGVMFALPQDDNFFIMRIDFDSCEIEMYYWDADPDDCTARSVLRTIADENHYTGFSSRVITLEVLDYVLEG